MSSVSTYEFHRKTTEHLRCNVSQSKYLLSRNLLLPVFHSSKKNATNHPYFSQALSGYHPITFLNCKVTMSLDKKHVQALLVDKK